MKTRILIIEDESTAARALTNAIAQVDSDLEVLGILESIEETIAWFRSNASPDLLFMDIHLADGSAFEIFREVKISCPIIFCTAYDAYAIQAFEVNSIGYILKPIQREALQKAMERFYALNTHSTAGDVPTWTVPDWEQLRNLLQPKTFRQQFLIPQRDRLIPLSAQNIAYFFTELKVVKAVCLDGSLFTMEQTLEELEEMLDPGQFFRMNRQCIVQHKAIKNIAVWFNGKLALDLTIKTTDRILISKARVPAFKQWFAVHV